MKKTIFQFLLLFVFGNMTAQTNHIVNGDFETYSTLPTCLNSAITKATGWSGISTSYTLGTCDSQNAVAANNGAANQPNYFNSASGGTSSCQPASSSAYSGTGFAFITFSGSSNVNAPLKAEYIYTTVNVGLIAGTTVNYSFWANSLGTMTTGTAYKVFLIPTSVGSSATAIMNAIKAADSTTPGLSVKGTSGYQAYTGSRYISTSASYYLVIGAYTYCNDANMNVTACIDNVKLTIQ